MTNIEIIILVILIVASVGILRLSYTHQSKRVHIDDLPPLTTPKMKIEEMSYGKRYAISPSNSGGISMTGGEVHNCTMQTSEREGIKTYNTDLFANLEKPTKKGAILYTDGISD